MWKAYIGLYLNGKVDCPCEYRPARATSAKKLIESLEFNYHIKYEVISKQRGTILIAEKELAPNAKCKYGAVLVKI